MNLNKKIVKTMVFALGLGMLSFAGVSQAKASGGAPAFNNGTGIFTAKTSTKFWAVAKPVKDAKKANVVFNGKNYVIKASDIEAYAGGINVAPIGEGKEVLIAYGDANTIANGKYNGWEVKTINAADSKFRVFYLGNATGKLSKGAAKHALGKEAGFLAAEVSEGKKVKELDLSTDHTKVQVKSGDGAWKKFAEFFGGADADKVNGKLKSLVQRGASLTFRYSADADTWAKEAKLKVPAQPKAPKVGVDVKKDEITSLKKGMEYNLKEQGEGAAVTPSEDSGDWKAVADKVKSLKITATDPAMTTGKNYVLFVRNKADKKKVVSKIAKISLKGTSDLQTNAAAIKGPEGFIVGEDSSRKVTISLVRKFDLTKGAVLTNKTTDDYEVYIDGAENASLPENGKWTLLKGKKKAESKDVDLKLKYSKTRKQNSYGDTKFSVLIRQAGKKLTNNEATLASKVAKVDVTLQNIEQVGSLVAITAGGTTGVADDEVGAGFIEGEDKEITFNYKITKYQKFDKKPKLTVATKTPNVTVKVDNFVEEGDNAIATITVKVGKKAKGTITQAFKIKAEGAPELSPTITLTGAAAGG